MHQSSTATSFSSPPAPSHSGQGLSCVEPPSSGGLINSLAVNHRLHPFDVSLAVTGVLGSIAGPYAGLVTPDGVLVRPGLNVLVTDDPSASFHDLESALFQPLRARTHFIRSRAACLSRKATDRWTFGTPPDQKARAFGTTPALQQRLEQLSSIRQTLSQMQGLPAHLFDYSQKQDMFLMDHELAASAPFETVVNRLPSLFAERLNLTQVTTLLNEALHREVLLFRPVGGMFNRGNLFDEEQEMLADQIAALIAGQDMGFSPLHPDQGHGTFSTARINLWAGTTVERVGSILSRPRSHWNDVLRNCLLWGKTECTAFPPQQIPVEKAHSRFRQCLHDLLELRCHGDHASQRRFGLPAENVREYRSQKAVIQDHLDNIRQPDRAYTMQFHDLFERLLWTLLQFSMSPGAAIKFATNPTLHAIGMQQRILSQARASVTQTHSLAVEKKLLQLLHRNGPSTLRDLQRSSNNLRKANLVPGLEQLIESGRVCRDAQKRFTLVTPEGASSSIASVSSADDTALLS